MNSNHYPLQWPPGWPRHKPAERKDGQFGQRAKGYHSPITLSHAIGRLMAEIKKFTKAGKVWRINPDSVTISCNIPMRKSDGMPYSNYKEPEDPGVAVYFNMDGEEKCLPCDTYNRLADNVAAIAAHLDAVRAIERHGVLDVKAMINARPALPEKAGMDNMPWWGVLNVPEKANLETIKYAFRQLSKVWHPDNPATGDAEKFHQLSRAYQEGISNRE